jgi:S1-C subfamily serine protease
MNQFVDLDDDGSFEVHFGKVLSSSPSSLPSLPPSPSSPPPPTAVPDPEKPEVVERRGSLFRAVVTAPRRYLDVNGDRAQALGLVSRAIKRVGPAVVRLETETYSESSDEGGIGPSTEKLGGRKSEPLQQRDDGNGPSNIGDPSYDDEGRGDIFDGVPGAPPPPAGDRAVGGHVDFGQGSGIIINGEGYILTNAHVVEGATRVYVLLTDGRRFKAEMRGSDDIVDIAVLKIVPEFGGADVSNDEHRRLMASLPVAELGDSNQIDVGQFVIAIGSPGGLDNTCTIGIISGLKRCPKVVGIPDKFGVLDYIQTDAASKFIISVPIPIPRRTPSLTVPFHFGRHLVNQGNSGGPLVEVESGNIVGINTCIRANMEGTSFAIPINKVMGIVDDLSEGKLITHGYLGKLDTTR